jgi:hypothetical protein
MAKSERKRPVEPDGYPITVDAWTLKCLYNRSDYRNRVESGQFVELYRESSKRRTNGEMTVQVYYGRSDDRLAMVRLQWFENEHGEIVRSGMKEPKWMYLDGFAFHMHRGDRSWERLRRDLTSFRPDTSDPRLIRLKKKYGDWRRYKCATFGAVEAWWRCRWFMSRPYGAYRLCGDRAQRTWIDARKALKPFRSWLRRTFSGPRGPALVLS